MLPDGTGRLVSWAKLEDVVQAMPVSVAAVSRARRTGDFIGLLGEARVCGKGRARVPARREQVCNVQPSQNLDLVCHGLR